MDLTILLREAVLRIDTTIKAGIPFEVNELFGYVKWNRLSKAEKIQFGILFSNEVDNGNITSIKKLPCGRGNHARYAKL